MEAIPPYIIFLFIVLLFSAFIKCATAFSILRYGLGINGICINIVFLLISFVFSLFILSPQVEDLGGVDGLLNSKISSIKEINQKFTPKIENKIDRELVEKLKEMAFKIKNKEEKDNEKHIKSLSKESSFFVMLLAYTITEVKRAFEIGLLLLIPFFVIDLLVANVLLLLGATNIKQHIVAVPIKILLFFAVDGWGLITGKIISDYL